MTRDKFDNYTHGDTGLAPGTSLNFKANERPDAAHFDWWWTTLIAAINGHADEFKRLDSDDDGIVDEADHATTADDADTLDGQHYGDIQAWVRSIAYEPDGDDAFRFETRTSDPSSPSDGRAWVRTDL